MANVSNNSLFRAAGGTVRMHLSRSALGSFAADWGLSSRYYSFCQSIKLASLMKMVWNTIKLDGHNASTSHETSLELSVTHEHRSTKALQRSIFGNVCRFEMLQGNFVKRKRLDRKTGLIALLHKTIYAPGKSAMPRRRTGKPSRHCCLSEDTAQSSACPSHKGHTAFVGTAERP